MLVKSNSSTQEKRALKVNDNPISKNKNGTAATVAKSIESLRKTLTQPTTLQPSSSLAKTPIPKLPTTTAAAAVVAAAGGIRPTSSYSVNENRENRAPGFSFRLQERSLHEQQRKFNMMSQELRELGSKYSNVEATFSNIHDLLKEQLACLRKMSKDPNEDLIRDASSIGIDLKVDYTIVKNHQVIDLLSVPFKLTNINLYGTKILGYLFTDDELASSTIEPIKSGKPSLDLGKLNILKACYFKKLASKDKFNHFWPSIVKSLKQKCSDKASKMARLKKDDDVDESEEDGELNGVEEEDAEEELEELPNLELSAINQDDKDIEFLDEHELSDQNIQDEETDSYDYFV